MLYNYYYKANEIKMEKKNNFNNFFVSFNPFSLRSLFPRLREQGISPRNFGAMYYPARAGVFNIQDILKGEISDWRCCYKKKKTKKILRDLKTID